MESIPKHDPISTRLGSEQLGRSDRKAASEVEMLLDKWRTKGSLDSIYSQPFARLPFQNNTVSLNNSQQHHSDQLSARLFEVGANSTSEQNNCMVMVNELAQSIPKGQQHSERLTDKHDHLQLPIGQEVKGQDLQSSQLSQQGIPVSQIPQNLPSQIIQDEVAMRVEPIVAVKPIEQAEKSKQESSSDDQMILEKEELIVERSAQNSTKSKTATEQSESEFKLRRLTTESPSANSSGSSSEQEEQEQETAEVSVRPFQAYTEQKVAASQRQEKQHTATTDDSSMRLDGPGQSGGSSETRQSDRQQLEQGESLSCGLVASSRQVMMDLDKELQRVAAEPPTPEYQSKQELLGGQDPQLQGGKDCEIAFAEELIVVTEEHQSASKRTEESLNRNLGVQFKQQATHASQGMKPSAHSSGALARPTRPSTKNAPKFPSPAIRQQEKLLQKACFLGKRAELPEFEKPVLSAAKAKHSPTPSRSEAMLSSAKKSSVMGRDNSVSARASLHGQRVASPSHSRQLSRSSEKLILKPSLPKLHNLAHSVTRTVGEPKFCKEIAARLAEAELVLQQRKPPLPKFEFLLKDPKPPVFREPETPVSLPKKPPVPKIAELLKKTVISGPSSHFADSKQL